MVRRIASWYLNHGPDGTFIEDLLLPGLSVLALAHFTPVVNAALFVWTLLMLIKREQMHNLQEYERGWTERNDEIRYLSLFVFGFLESRRLWFRNLGASLVGFTLGVVLSWYARR